MTDFREDVASIDELEHYDFAMNDPTAPRIGLSISFEGRHA